MKLASANQSVVSASVSSILEDFQNGKRSLHAPLLSKVCSTFALIMVSSPDACQSTMEQMLAGASTGEPGRILLFLTFAKCVCEELDEAEIAFNARDAMELLLSALSEDVVKLIAKILTAQRDPLIMALHGEAFGCLKVWIKKAGISLTKMFAQEQSMLYVLLEALCMKSSHLLICADILCIVIKISEYPTPSDQEIALAAISRGLMKTRPACESAIAEDENEVSHAITTVVSTFCETYVDWILEGSIPEAVELADLMLFLGTHPRRQIASLTLEFWLLVQEEPVADRHVFFQREAFVRLLDVLLEQCTYPQECDDMDEFDLDDLLAFRNGSQGVTDCFLAVFALLKEQFLAQILTSLSGSLHGNWRTIEACLFSVSTVSDDLKKRLSRSPSELDIMMTQLFQSVLNFANPHYMVVAIAAKLLGQYGSWFNQKAVSAGTPDVVASVLLYLDKALANGKSRSNAAKSFMQIATSCSSCLAQMAPEYLTSGVKYFQSGQIAIDDRLLIVEGIVRAATVSPNCTVILQVALDDSLNRLDQMLGASGPVDDEMLPAIVVDELLVLSKVVRFLDAPSDVAGGKVVTSWAVSLIWPHLEPIVTRSNGHEATIDALFQLYGWCLQSLREEMVEQLPFIANLIVQVFERHQFVSPLACASIAVDIFGKNAEGNPQVVDSFRGLLGVLSQLAFQFFMKHSLSDSPDVLRSFYELAYRFLLFCPAAVVTANEFPVLLQLSIACIGNQDRASTNAVLVFLSYLIGESRGKLQAYQPHIDACVLSIEQIELLTDAIVSALASKSPSVLFNPVGRLFFAFLSNFGENEAVQSQLYHAMTLKGDALGVKDLSMENRQLILQLWMKFALTPTREADRRFRGLCADFAKICRKELTADSLPSYEL